MGTGTRVVAMRVTEVDDSKGIWGVTFVGLGEGWIWV